MNFKIPRLVVVLAGVGALLAVALVAWVAWRAWTSTPGYNFRDARRRWEARPFRHYRLSANYEVNWAQCHYDIEVLDERVVGIYGVSCLSSAESKTLTVDGMFQTYERFIAGRVCSPNGCYCEGRYVVHATYDSTWGHPQSITTRFHRNWLDDLIRGKRGVEECLTTRPVVEKIVVNKLTPLP